MLSLFLVLAPAPQEEAKQRKGNPVRFAAPSGGAAPLHPHLATPERARRVRSPPGEAT